jgi:hypothetical protein
MINGNDVVFWIIMFPYNLVKIKLATIDSQLHASLYELGERIKFYQKKKNEK